MILTKETCPSGLGFASLRSSAPSVADVRAAVQSALVDGVSHFFLQLRPGCVTLRPEVARRLSDIAHDTSAPILYGSWREGDDTAPLRHTIAYQLGSVRDDFDFGPLVLVNAAAAQQALTRIADSWQHAGWYALRLAMSETSLPVHTDEEICVFQPAARTEAGQFDYLDPTNRDIQKELETVVTWHLKNIGAWIDPSRLKDAAAYPEVAARDGAAEGNRPMASVIIPVKNREKTIADAIRSAVGQDCEWAFNIIVVDNHSTDHTLRIARREATFANTPAHPDRLVIITPEAHNLNIGGCWNLAVQSPHCGRYIVQLDSDDLYDGTDVLRRIVEAMREQRCVALAGSYRLTDFALRPLPPGVIDHREWTAENGMNNALRINGLGAPRAFLRAFLLRFPLPDTSYGEDYAAMLRASRDYRIGRIYEPLYLCRRWTGNSDASPTAEQTNARNAYKDTLRTVEILARQRKNFDSAARMSPLTPEKQC